MTDNRSLSHSEEKPRHEARESSLRAVFIIAASVVFMLVSVFVASVLVLHHYAKTRPMQSMQPLGVILAPDLRPLKRFPSPNLEIDDGHADRVILQTREQEELDGYGWVDRSNRIVHIPIAHAMDLIASRGLPTVTNSGPAIGNLTLPSIANQGHE